MTPNVKLLVTEIAIVVSQALMDEANFNYDEARKCANDDPNRMSFLTTARTVSALASAVAKSGSAFAKLTP